MACIQTTPHNKAVFADVAKHQCHVCMLKVTWQGPKVKNQNRNQANPMSNGSVSLKFSEIPRVSLFSRVTIQEGLGGNRWFPRCEEKKNYFWIPYPMGCFSASSEPVLMEFQGVLWQKHVDSSHGAIPTPSFHLTAKVLSRRMGQISHFRSFYFIFAIFSQIKHL